MERCTDERDERAGSAVALACRTKPLQVPHGLPNHCSHCTLMNSRASHKTATKQGMARGQQV